MPPTGMRWCVCLSRRFEPTHPCRRHQDAAYRDALVRMFEQALRTATDAVKSETVRNCLLGTLDQVRSIGRELGYGIGDDMDVLFAEFVSSSRRRVIHGNR